MDVNIADLEGRFDELVELAKAGESVVVRNGQSAAKLLPVEAKVEPTESAEARAARVGRVIEEIQEKVRRRFAGKEMPTSDHSDLYDEFGLPK